MQATGVSSREQGLNSFICGSLRGIATPMIGETVGADSGLTSNGTSRLDRAPYRDRRLLGYQMVFQRIRGEAEAPPPARHPPVSVWDS